MIEIQMNFYVKLLHGTLSWV